MLRLTPRGGRDAIDGIETLSDGRSVLKARVRAVPEDGEANRAVERLIAKTLGVPNSAVRVGTGHTSRIKNIAVDGEPSVLLKKLENLTRFCGADMSARVIDGKAVAAALREQVAAEALRLKNDHGLTPGLAVVLVGTDPASQVYVRNKVRTTTAANMASFEHILPADTTQAALLALVDKLNRDPAVHGILVQLPLPKHLDSQAVVAAIDPAKDVDGLTPINAGRLASGMAGAWRLARPSAASFSRSRFMRRWKA